MLWRLEYKADPTQGVELARICEIIRKWYVKKNDDD